MAEHISWYIILTLPLHISEGSYYSGDSFIIHVRNADFKLIHILHYC